MNNIGVKFKETYKSYVVSVDFGGSNYLMVFGEYTNGGFFCITNHGVSGELAQFHDTFYNAESIGRALNDYKAGKALALVIKEVGYND